MSQYFDGQSQYSQDPPEHSSQKSIVDGKPTNLVESTHFAMRPITAPIHKNQSSSKTRQERRFAIDGRPPGFVQLPPRDGYSENISTNQVENEFTTSKQTRSRQFEPNKDPPSVPADIRSPQRRLDSPTMRCPALGIKDANKLPDRSTKAKSQDKLARDTISENVYNSLRSPAVKNEVNLNLMRPIPVARDTELKDPLVEAPSPLRVWKKLNTRPLAGVIHPMSNFDNTRNGHARRKEKATGDVFNELPSEGLRLNEEVYPSRDRQDSVSGDVPQPSALANSMAHDERQRQIHSRQNLERESSELSIHSSLYSSHRSTSSMYGGLMELTRAIGDLRPFQQIVSLPPITRKYSHQSAVPEPLDFVLIESAKGKKKMDNVEKAGGMMGPSTKGRKSKQSDITPSYSGMERMEAPSRSEKERTRSRRKWYKGFWR